MTSPALFPFGRNALRRGKLSKLLEKELVKIQHFHQLNNSFGILGPSQQKLTKHAAIRILSDVSIIHQSFLSPVTHMLIVQ
jgi:hypothetical protein